MPTPNSEQQLELVVITGMSGSGKSAALKALEDTGYHSVDNLAPELLEQFLSLMLAREIKQVAVAIDARNHASLPQMPALLTKLKEKGINLKLIFLEASSQTLLRRFSETRRKHPLSLSEDQYSKQAGQTALVQAIEREKELLCELRQLMHIIDTSELKPATLISQVKSFVKAPASHLTLVIESFAFKRGIALDADYVFDVRMLPNPHYEPELRPLTGRDKPVQEYLEKQEDVQKMQQQIYDFITTWLPKLAENHRSYVTVAIGCTGGQHRSVYLVEMLTKKLSQNLTCISRHRELD